MVTMFMSAFCAVSESLAVTPHSRSRLPSMRQPSRGATEGRNRQVATMMMMGKRIFSDLETLRVGFMTMARSFLVVMSLMSGG